MIGFAWKLADAHERRSDRPAPDALSAPQAFGLGAGLTIAGVPGALPYFGAIDQILRANLDPIVGASALVFYNVVFLLPLALLLSVHLLLPARSEQIFARVKSVADRFGRRLMIAVLTLLGAVLVIDGIGWFVGYPLLPTG